MDLCGQSNALLFNVLSRSVIAFFPRSNCLLISQLQSPSSVILEPKKIKWVIVFTFPPSIRHEVMGPDAMIFVFWMLNFKPALSFSFLTFIKRLLVLLAFCHRVVSSAYCDYWYFSMQSWFQFEFHQARHFTWCTLHVSWISRVTIYNLDELLSQLGTSLLFHVQF